MKNHRSRWQDRVNLVLGVWLVLAPLVSVGHGIAEWNSYLVGGVVTILAGAAISGRQAWGEWVNMVVAVWLIIAPFVLHFTDQYGAMWNQVIVGVMVSIDDLWAGIYLPAPRQLL